ncbi:MAG: hypothetical protein ACLR4Z_11320 [Butyricicoccaceae bacterium]
MERCETAGRRKPESFLVQWSRSETLQAQIDGREQEKRACSEKRAAAAEDRPASGGRGAAEGCAAAGEYIRKKGQRKCRAGSLRSWTGQAAVCSTSRKS